jgi:hypothetical protein
MRYNRLEYLVKWKGYDESHNQWEERMQLHAKSKIAQFHRKTPAQCATLTRPSSTQYPLLGRIWQPPGDPCAS